ncbi:MAG: hypothetical protein QOJ16_4926 [Acidobacteriota bacterium]|jgi:uncharacterized protein (TIGR02271 family)|nr:hypothetical protein [Acidobacteriota bacterium]
MRNTTVQDRLVPLENFSDTQGSQIPDVRGWPVVAADGRKIGKVDQLLAEGDPMRLRYLDVDLDHGFFQADRHVLVPIDNTRLDARERQMVVEGLDSAALDNLPPYTGEFTDEYESSLTRFFGRGKSVGTADRAVAGRQVADVGQEERKVTLAEEELAFGKRAVSAGEVTVQKHVETEHVRQSVPVLHEEVTVERRPVTGDRTDVEITDDEIRVPIAREEVVVQKRVVPKEELVIKKHQVQGEQVVEDEVRRERAEVHGAEGTATLPEDARKRR